MVRVAGAETTMTFQYAQHSQDESAYLGPTSTVLSPAISFPSLPLSPLELGHHLLSAFIRSASTPMSESRQQRRRHSNAPWMGLESKNEEEKEENEGGNEEEEGKEKGEGTGEGGRRCREVS
eukprot:3793003-Pyramimonas_sp.AAC.1